MGGQSLAATPPPKNGTPTIPCGVGPHSESGRTVSLTDQINLSRKPVTEPPFSVSVSALSPREGEQGQDTTRTTASATATTTASTQRQESVFCPECELAAKHFSELFPQATVALSDFKILLSQHTTSPEELKARLQWAKLVSHGPWKEQLTSSAYLLRNYGTISDQYRKYHEAVEKKKKRARSHQRREKMTHQNRMIYGKSGDKRER